MLLTCFPDRECFEHNTAIYVTVVEEIPVDGFQRKCEVASIQCHILTEKDYALIFTNILYTFFYDTTAYFKYTFN
jgi:hypothetical protein